MKSEELLSMSKNGEKEKILDFEGKVSDLNQWLQQVTEEKGFLDEDDEQKLQTDAFNLIYNLGWFFLQIHLRLYDEQTKALI